MNWQKAGIDISQVRGGKGFCPKCHPTRKNKRDRSLSVDMKEGLYKCHNAGCDFSGSVVDFQPKKEYKKPLPKLQKVSDKMLEYFQKRGISNDTLLRVKVTEAVEYMPQLEKNVRVICFNYYEDDELVNVKYRSANKDFKLVSGAKLIFYNINAFKGAKTGVIVEGEVDVLSMVESGVYDVVSVPNGASMGKSSRLEYLDNCWSYFENLEKIVIATDDDEAGVALKAELVRRLGDDRCYEVKYPKGCKDANEVLVNHGKDAVKELVELAQPMPVEHVERVEDKVADVVSIYNHGYPKTLRVNYNELNEFIRWRVGELTVVTGIPNHGKSTWLNNLIVQLASIHGWRFAMFTPEKAPSEILIAELATIYIGKPFYRSNSEDKMTVDEMKKALDFINNHFFILKTDEVNATVEGLISKFTQMVNRYGVNSVVIDPWNYLEHNYDKKSSETEFVSDSLSKLANFCKKKKVHTFLVAHPKKMQKRQDGKYFVPALYDISGSAHFNNKADNGVTVYRDYEEKKTEIHIQKVRWFFVGKTGMVDMYFNTDGQRFTETHPSLHGGQQIEVRSPFAGMPKTHKDINTEPF